MKPASILIALSAAACVVVAASFAGTDPARRGPVARGAVIDLLAEAPLQRALAGWGLDADDVAHDVGALSDDEVVSLASGLEQLGRNEDPRAVESQALYLALVAQMRGSSLYASLLSRLL